MVTLISSIVPWSPLPLCHPSLFATSFTKTYTERDERRIDLITLGNALDFDLRDEIVPGKAFASRDAEISNARFNRHARRATNELSQSSRFQRYEETRRDERIDRSSIDGEEIEKKSLLFVNFREPKRGWSQLNRSILWRKTVASGARSEVK